MAGALDRYWWCAQTPEEGRNWYERALAAADDAPPADVARAHLGFTGMFSGPSDVARDHASAALAGFEQIGDYAGIGASLLRLGTQIGLAGDMPAAAALAQRAIAHARNTDDPWLIGSALTTMAAFSSDLPTATSLLAEGIEYLQPIGAHDRIAGALSAVAFHALCVGDCRARRTSARAGSPPRPRGTEPHILALTLGNQGLTALIRERPDDAADAFREQLAVARADARHEFYSEGLSGLAAVAAHRRHDDLAAMLTAAARPGDRPISAFEQPVYDRIDARYLAGARDRLGATAWARATARGFALDADDALDLALATFSRDAPPVN